MADSATDLLSGTTTATTTTATDGAARAATTTGVDVQAGTVQGGDAVANAKDSVGFDWKANGVTADEDIGYLQTKAYKGPADVLKALRSAETLIGRDKIPMPKDDTDTEGWNRVFARLGRPESADKYDLGKLPDNADKEYIGAMLKSMHAAGASQKVVSAAFKAQLEFEQSRQTAAATQRQVRDTEQMATLRQEWGKGFDTQVEHGRRAIREQGIPKETLSAIEEAIGPAKMVKLFAGYGSKFAEDHGVNNQGEGSFGRLTPQQAKFQISQLMADPEFVRKYTNGTNAEREFTKKQMQQLQEAAAPV